MQFIKHITLLSSSLLLTGCLQAGQMAQANLSQALQASDRPAADKARDQGRLPVQVMDIFDIKPGMRVLDMFAAGGYYTEVLSHQVGDSGEVVSHNTDFLLNIRKGVFNQQMTTRLANNRLPNVTRYHRELGSLDLDQEVDAITLILNYHDLYNRDKSQRMAVLKDLHTALKPGGTLGIIDSQANPGQHNPALHRVNKNFVKAELAAIGFKLEQESDLLANPNDDHTLLVFNPEIRGKTDRFILKYRK